MVAVGPPRHDREFAAPNSLVAGEMDPGPLVERARFGLWAIIISNAVFALTDLRLASAVLLKVYLLKAVQLAVAGAAFPLLRSCRTAAGATAVILITEAVVCAVVAMSGAVTSDITTTLILCLAIAWGAAVILPWGARQQLAAALLAGAAIVGNIYLTRGDLSAVVGYPTVAVALALGISVYLAHHLEGRRRAMAQSAAALRLSEANLREAHDALEIRVHERTAELEAANAQLHTTAEALRESERRFRTLIERSLDLVAIIDRDGTYRYVNPAHEAVCGFTPEQLVGTMAFDLLHPDDVRELAPILAAAIQTGVMMETVEYRIRHRDGSWHDVEGIALNLVDDPEVAGILITGRDITERKRAEERTRAHVLRLQSLQEIDRAILDARSVDALVGAALEGVRRLVPCELAVALLFDVEHGVAHVIAGQAEDARRWGDVTTLPLEEFSAPATFVESPMLYVEDITTLAPRSPIVDRLCAAGMHSLLTEAFIAEGQLLGLMTLAAATPAAFGSEHRDIAREVANQLTIAIAQARLREVLQRHAAELEDRVRERTAQLEAANEELESFSYSVSHDLRAPLRHIEGFSRLLLEDYGAKLDAGGKGYLDRVQASAQRMGQLIEDLLSLSRVTRAQIVRRVVHLGELAQAIAAHLQKSQPDRRVEFVIAPGVVAEGDARLLRVALENLLDNAWKYTSKHSAARIEFGTAEGDGGIVYFVRDDGAGFDPAYAGKLFVPFQRLHAESEFEGTGIGLATVQRIIHRHGGRVWAEGATERGATVYFTLGSSES